MSDTVVKTRSGALAAGERFGLSREQIDVIKATVEAALQTIRDLCCENPTDMVGEAFRVDVIQMRQSEYDALPEFEGW